MDTHQETNNKYVLYSIIPKCHASDFITLLLFHLLKMFNQCNLCWDLLGVPNLNFYYPPFSNPIWINRSNETEIEFLSLIQSQLIILFSLSETPPTHTTRSTDLDSASMVRVCRVLHPCDGWDGISIKPPVQTQWLIMWVCLIND